METMKTLSQEEARSALDSLPLDDTMIAALGDPAHLGHKAATAHRRKLYAAAYPTDATIETESGQPPATLYKPPEGPHAYRFEPSPAGLRHDQALEEKILGQISLVQTALAGVAGRGRPPRRGPSP
jgi:hypothetical protein